MHTILEDHFEDYRAAVPQHRLKSLLTSCGRRVGLVALFAILLLGHATLAAVWHHDTFRTQDRDCPVCQIAHLPVIQPATAVQLAAPTFVERQAIQVAIGQELKRALCLRSPRGPPAA